MKKCFFALITFIILTSSLLQGQDQIVEKGLRSINQDVIKAQLGFLASDWTEGRRTGEKGEYIASDYIASMLQLYGVKPGGDYVAVRDENNKTIGRERTYFQNFILLKTSPGDEHILEIKSVNGELTKISRFTNGIDFSTRLTVNDINLEAPVVFVGYGFKSDKLNFNDFAKIDIKGKFILKLSGFPSYAYDRLTAEERAEYLREFETLVLSGGAVGIIEVNPEIITMNSHRKSEFENLSPSENRPRPSETNTLWSIPGKKNPDNIARITATIKIADEILKGTGMSIDDYIMKADKNSPYNFSLISAKSVYLKSTRKQSTVKVRNVVGIIEGQNPDEVLVMGAHYDHMGMNDGYIWNGADDNASGTVAVMTIAKAIMDSGQKPEKTILAALWTGEEEGLLGSRYWVQNSTVPLKDVKLNLNFDMISRYVSEEQQKRVTMTYTSLFPSFKTITEDNLKMYGIDLLVDYAPSADPPGGTDHRSFVAADIPIMRFKPGHREEYHTPYDEYSTLDWDIMEKIIRISYANLWELANSNW